MMKLFTYYRSSASYRVRIALNLKGLNAEYIPVNLLKLEQRAPDYAVQNPQQLVPALITEEESSERGSGQGFGQGFGQSNEHSSGHNLEEVATLTQSLAIMEYLDERYPGQPLLPAGAAARARVRALAQSIACEIAPLNNLRVRNYLTQEMGLTDEQSLAWSRHWIAIGLSAVEAMLEQSQTGIYCHGDKPTLADCCLVPQVYNSRRFECDLTPYPRICRITAACESLQAFVDAHPDAQPDAGGG